MNIDNLTEDSIAIYYSNIGFNLNNIEGLQYLEKALKLSQKSKNLKLQSRVLENLSHSNRILGNKVKAIDYILKAIEINKTFKNKYLEALNYSQLAGIYYADKDYLEAKKYYEIAQSTYPKEFKSGSKHRIINYMSLLLNTGDTYRILEDYDKAIHLFSKVLNLNEQTEKDEIVFGYAHGNLGMTQMSIQQTFEAEKNLKLGVHYLKRVGDDITAEIFRVELGKLRLQENKEEFAESLFLNAYSNFKALHAKEQIRDITELLSSFYEERNQFDKALFYEKEKEIYKDSLINKESIKKIEQAKHQMELNEMEHEMELLRQEAKFRFYISMAIVSIALILVGFGVRFYFESVKKKKINITLRQQRDMLAEREEEKALLLKELNHRVKNNLQMISSLLNLQSRKLGDHPAVSAIDSGRFRVEAMSLIHQKLYQKDVHTEIEIDTYLQELVLNLMYSFQASFTPTFNIKPVMLHIDKAIPMGLIVNEFVTNAMKYAYEGVEDPKMWIDLKEIKGEIIVKVKDNGVGILKGKSGGTNFGLNLVDSLVKQLDGKVSYETDRGTTCVLMINK
ncbi:histidine kinase dimerization/phosphoacceptor domain -containing protein [Flammeovirga sp. EKP202]|uniref:tetratricopeptide repeat-containing sensor histidine kinase n=1 Tax=Flammeovirga sp. EKP202 TaxID=2770592 RepID=UPI00165FE280|nr:histidine kinase dimerization/phosphoacceptor domain -containing protein [Flammeovirga sp. EKP202]MBD0405282.1 tetratricopeptide repeat protein [Flammeovirga sp. EKP202]